MSPARWLGRVGPVLGALATLATSAAADVVSQAPPTRPTEVRAGVYLDTVDAVDERAETFEIEATLTLTWSDARQAFDPNREAVAEKIYQGDFQLRELYASWWPQTILANGDGPREPKGVSLRIRPDGTMVYVESFHAVVKMPIDLRAFPLDRHAFRAIFRPLDATRDEIVLRHDPATSGRAALPDVAEWHLETVGVGTEEAVRGPRRISQLVLTLQMARRPAYIVGTIMLPLTFLVFLTWSIFWMDEEGLAARMDISFIGILTVIAYQFVVTDELPQISYFTLFDGFLVSAYGLMGAAVVVNIAVDKLNRSGRKLAGDQLDATSRWLFPLTFASANVVFYLLLA